MGRYRLDEQLGSGGSAEVWRGTDERLRRPVAIKLLHPHLLRDETERGRFDREARAAAALSHPGIVTVYDIDPSAAGPAIVFELVEGATLSERLARGPLAPGEAARIAAELADALQHAHERGVVHRDVKPGNVLLDRDGRARLADFGIARVIEQEAAALTTADLIPGTLGYLAPERLAGAEATASADLYALGVVLYEMVTGHPPFQAVTLLALAEAQQRGPAPAEGVPPTLEALWRDALQADPTKRPRDAAAMAVRLRAVADRHRKGTTAAVQSAQATVADDPTVAVAAPEEASWPLPTQRRRGRPAWVSAAVPVFGIAVAAIALAGLTGQVFQPPESTVPPAIVSPSTTPTVDPSPTAAPTEQPSASDPGNDKGKGKGKGRDD